MITFQQINWNKIWEEKMKSASGVASWSGNGAERGLNRWNEAEFRPTRTGDDEYATKLIEKIYLNLNYSVLDIGCGSGILSIPIAKKVREVTALDVSQRILEVLKKKALKNNINNINYLQGDWKIIKPDINIPVHDVVMASRCLGMFDLKDELIKINNFAKKQAYITRIVEEQDIISPKIYELLGREFQPLPNYYYIYNLLYQLGIKANIEFILVDDVEEKYNSIDHAINVWKWKLNKITKEEELTLRNFLEDNLIHTEENQWSTGPINCKWALISWIPRNKINIGLDENKQKEITEPNWHDIWINLHNNYSTKNINKNDFKKWNMFARHFNKGVLKDWNNKNSYINQLVNRIEADNQDIVLDLGCASGGISIPIAKKVKSITAIDISSEMISYLNKNIRQKNISNIKPINAKWEDVVSKSNFPKHDIVIASRCLSGPDLKEKLIKINSIASKRVYFTWIIKISNLQKAIYNVLNREFEQEPSYIYIFNLLQSLSINPAISFIFCQNSENFVSIEDAIEYYEWILKGINNEEKEKLHHYFEKQYIRKGDRAIGSPPNLLSEWAWVVFEWEKRACI